MREYEVRKTQFTIADFLSWQRAGTLNLTPPFQRRSVWQPGAKSYFMDTVVKGLPAPIIYLRQNLDLHTQQSVREVVDGQQRLRTVLTYIDASSLKDYDPQRDAFRVKAVHSAELADRPFSRIAEHLQRRILSYEFSTHILPIDIEDREVLEMFARLNATGVKLNHQELRNAKYFGEFKSAMYDLALEQLERWRDWNVFSNDQIARMKEVEAISDLVMNMLKGLTGKTQKRLDDLYKELDDEFPSAKQVALRFRTTMDQIDDLFGKEMSKTVYSSEVHFFTLFIFLYDELFGLGVGMKKIPPKKLKAHTKAKLLAISHEFATEAVPKNVLDAVQRASADYGRRKTRLDYMRNRSNA